MKTALGHSRFACDEGIAERIPGNEECWRLTPKLIQLARAHDDELRRVRQRVDDIDQRYTRAIDAEHEVAGTGLQLELIVGEDHGGSSWVCGTGTSTRPDSSSQVVMCREAAKSGLARTARCNAAVVAGPSTRSSVRARRIRAIAAQRVGAQAITFAIIES